MVLEAIQGQPRSVSQTTPGRPEKGQHTGIERTETQRRQTREADHPPAVGRWLREGNEEKIGGRNDRDGYAKGEEGMAQYLRAWEQNWARLSHDAAGRKES